MCGHGTIGVTTALIELGIVDSIEPYTTITYETCAGLVNAKALVKDGAVIEVSLHNLPSFYLGTFDIKMRGNKIIPIDVAYGGNFYAITEAKNLNTRVRKERIDELIKKGIFLRDTAARQIKVYNPITPDIPKRISLAMITDDPELPQSNGKNIVIFGKGQFDRSPCGTGTIARLSILYKKDKLKIGETFTHESVINTLFRAKILKTAKIGQYEGILTEITGRAFITQISQTIISSNDPLKYGFSTH
jgi:proline racemase